MTPPRLRSVRTRPGEYRVIVEGQLVGRVARSAGGRVWAACPRGTDQWLPARHRTRTEAVGALLLVAERVAS